MMVNLDEHCMEPAYLCGRLLALLDTIQYHAIGRVNATISDRYYETALSAPALVFPHLVYDADKHLAAIRRAQGRVGFLQRELNMLLDKMREIFPTHLSPQEHGYFVLGFHHQQGQYLMKPEEQKVPQSQVQREENSEQPECEAQSDEVWQDILANTILL